MATARLYSSAAALGPLSSKAIFAEVDPGVDAALVRSDEASQDPSRFPVGADPVQFGCVRDRVEIFPVTASVGCLHGGRCVLTAALVARDV